MSAPASLPLMIDLSAPAITADERELLSERRVAAVCLFGRNVVDRFQLADYVAELRALAGERLIVAIDQEGGGVVRLRDVPVPPAAMALGAADDVELTRRVAEATARGLRAVGVNLDFAPVADVNSNPGNPVIADRSFGSDPELVGRHVAAFVTGLQREGVGATLKHFPGHGDTDVDSHLALPTLRHDAAYLHGVDLPPFAAGVAAGAAAVMSAHIVLPALDPDLPATLSRRALHDLLRLELGFDGVIVTDALDMRAIKDAWPAPVAAVMALRAGADLPVTIGTVAEHRLVLDAIEAASRDGRLDEAEYAAVRRRLETLAARFAVGEVDPHSAWRPGGADDELLDEAAAKGLVVRGEPPRLRPGDRVVLVARGSVAATAAAQVVTRPADALADALARAGVAVQRFDVDGLDLGEVGGAVRGQAARAAGSHAGEHAPGGLPAPAAALVFASTTRVRMAPDEAVMARALHELARAVGAPFLHVALWNPYNADDVPGPAVIAFGHGPRQARAVVSRLVG